MNDREIDEALHHLKWFSVYSETILAPALGNAQARGDNLGPFGVWKLMARLKDPNKSGFEVYTHFEPTEVDREIVGKIAAQGAEHPHVFLRVVVEAECRQCAEYKLQLGMKR